MTPTSFKNFCLFLAPSVAEFHSTFPHWSYKMAAAAHLMKDFRSTIPCRPYRSPLPFFPSLLHFPSLVTDFGLLLCPFSCKEMQTEPVEGCFVELVSPDNVFAWRVFIEGPSETP
jgi:hypothetical protein